MDLDRWKRLDALLQDALERSPEQRDAFLHDACGGDLALEQEVRALLSSGQRAGSFLESPAIQVAARGIREEPSITSAAADAPNGKIRATAS